MINRQCQNIELCTGTGVLTALRHAWLYHKFDFRFIRIAVLFSLGTSQVSTYCFTGKTIANYHNFVSTTTLIEIPLIKDTKTVKVSAIPTG